MSTKEINNFASNDVMNMNEEMVSVSEFATETNGKLESSVNVVDLDESSSSESLVEIRLNEFVKEAELSGLDIQALVVRCTSCGSQIHYRNKDLKVHRRLGVITCKECYEFYGSSEFSQDESGYNYCTWCGNGGKLIVCDYCPNGFCSACIRRNFGRAEISVTTKEGWKCYCCNRSRLKPKVKFCDMIMKHDKMSVKKDKKSLSLKTKTSTLETFLQTTFDESEKSCKSFHNKFRKLKAIGVGKSKSLKHIVQKMEETINNHKRDLNRIVNYLSKQYLIYIDLKSKLEEEEIANENKSNSGVNGILLDQNENGDQNKKNNLSPTIESIFQDDCVIIDDTPEKSNSEEERNLSPLLKSEAEDSNKHDSEKMKAKLSLLLSSSESDDESTEHNEKSADKQESNFKTSASDSVAVVSKARRKLDMDISDSDLLDFQCDNHTIEENISDLNEEKIKEFDLKNDLKLKCLPEVILIRCDYLLKDGETSVNITEKCRNISDDEDGTDKLDKLIDNLCKFPIKQKSKIQRKQTSVHKIKAPKKTVKSESSSSISLSSDEESMPALDKKIPNKIAKAKEELMNSDSSVLATEDEEEEEEEDVKSKKSRHTKKKNSDSSDDFQPRKKRKYDKLLHGTILTDDEKKSKDTKDKKKKKKRVLSSEEEKQKKTSNKSSSSTTSDSDEEAQKKNSRKRRRIKKIASSSEENEDKTKGDTPAGKRRKNIKKIISQKKLADATKEAQLEEKERKKRIEERQMLYNKIEDTSVDGKEIITRKMVLEVDKESKEEIVEIHPDLVCKLKPHQVNGVKFMWECTIETVKDLEKPGSGCILAHCMGLGKTLQVIAFFHTCLNNSRVNKYISKTMVICPYNVALNWATEFDYWLDEVEGNIKVHQLATAKSNLERLDILRYWFEEGGVMIISYDIFRRLAGEKIPKMKAKERNRLHTYLLDPGPDVVVCDEGHVLKNESSAISKATGKLRTRRRIVLTGTPLQNNLKEYHCMLSFVKPNLLGTSKEFRNRFVNPIMNGQYDDSTTYDVKLMKKRIHILHKLLEGCVHRCDYSALTKFLPPKHEFVISVKLSEIQIKMYECYLEKISMAKKEVKCSGSTLFVDFNNLRCIWTHPYICHVSHEKAEIKRLYRDDTDEEFINDKTESSSSSSSPNGSTSNDDKVIVKRVTRSKAEEDVEVEDITEEKSKQWYEEFISEEDKCNIQLSGKMVLLIEILKECESIGDKVILFSQSLLALNAIESILTVSASQPQNETDKLRDVFGTWIKGLDYFRMDGTTSADFRKSYIDMFNDPRNDRARLFLISTKAGSLGTNLVGANRVIIFDTSWNPSHDVQAIFRAYRFGQLKPVYIYRLLAQGTMEEKIYDRQVTKLSLSCRVVDEQQIDRHFSAADLAELYMFDRNSTTNRPTPLVPKDRLLAELLIRNSDWIVTYHEHDSLLQSQTEEDLTEEERQAAWTEYENEREGKTVLNTSGLNEDEFNTFAREPDFTSSDYDGKMIPDLKNIIDNLYERLKSQMPGLVHTVEFKKKLLYAVYRVRQAFQEKHVKILRMKQEYIAHGTVPNTINKYIDELSQILKSTGDYILRLQTAINQEEIKASAHMQEQMKRMQQASQQAFMQQLRNNANRKQTPIIVIRRGVAPQPNVAQHPFINQRFNFSMPRPGFVAYTNNARTYTRNQNASSQPTITEVTEDNVSEPVKDSSEKNTTNKTSTVVIEEIS